MLYREFGKTGKKVSILGFGAMRVLTKPDGEKNIVNDELAIPLLQKGFDLGINYVDTAWGYTGEDNQRAVGVALKGYRDKVYLATKIPTWAIKEQKDFRSYLEEALKRLDTNYIDFYHFHGLNESRWNEKVKQLNLLSEVKKAKEEGLIKHMSFSFHDKAELMKEIADSNAFDSLLCQYNILDRANEESMKYCAEKGLGIAVMGPLCGGNISDGGENFRKHFDTEFTTAEELAFNFVWSNSSVSTALSGMNTMEQLLNNVKYAERFEAMSNAAHKKIAEKADSIKATSDIYCTQCRYCDVCPQGVKPYVGFKAYNNWKIWGFENFARREYAGILDNDAPSYGNDISVCLECGKCSSMCPQYIDIPEKLRKATAEFEKQFK